MLKPLEFRFLNIGKAFDLEGRGFPPQFVYRAVSCELHQIGIEVALIREIKAATLVPQRGKNILGYVLGILT